MIAKLGMPKWGLSMTEGRLLSWLKEVGDAVSAGDELCEVETEKIMGAVEATASGVLRRHVHPAGDVVPVGGLIGVIADADVPDSEIDAFVAEFEASFVPEAEEDDGAQPEMAGPIRYLEQGDAGEPVVLIHGFGGDLDNWRFLLPALIKEHTVYALDLPGHGGSTKDVGDGTGLADAVIGFLDAAGLDRPHLVGHSLGALVAAQVAARGRGASLTMVAPAGFGQPVNQEYLDGFIAAESRRELKPALQLLFADESLVTRSLVDDVLKYKRIDGVTEALTTLRRAAFVDAPEVDVPVLTIWGAEDRIIPPGADAELIDGAGHSPHMEAAGEVNRLIDRFLTAAV
jgi:pyruvate dehydrogenase E2 component (dihydrolipoyllysine-residue acetyltransferase)